MSSRTGVFAFHAAITLTVVAAALLVFSLFGGAEIQLGELVLRAQEGGSAPLEPPPANTLTAAHLPDPGAAAPGRRPRNVVIIVGDGMGIGTVSSASVLLRAPGVPLIMESAPVVGLMHTWAADKLATDSAAAATAMATGFKTDTKVLGRTPDGRPVRNLYEAARAAGLATGVITTSALADATPGGFLAHAASREHYGEVLSQVLDSGTDVLIGGDWSGKRKAWRSRPYREVVETAEQIYSARGVTVIRDAERLSTAALPVIALLPPRPEDPLAHGPALSVSTGHALELLGGASNGYLLLVESEVTDEAGHANDINALMTAMRELEDVLSLVLDTVVPGDETLVVVVADHETGGPHLLEGRYADGKAVVRWAHAYHSAQLVPLFAFGPGAENFSGVCDNTDFAPRIAALLGLEDLPEMADTAAN